MLVDLLLDAVLGLLTLILSAIPDASLPSVATNALDDFAVQIGGALGGLDGVLPISEISVFVAWVLGTLVPIFAVYSLSLWVWRNLPVIGGRG